MTNRAHSFNEGKASEAILGFGRWRRTCQHAALLRSGIKPMTFSCPSSSQEALLKRRIMSNHGHGLGESRFFLTVWPFSEKHWKKNCNKVQMKSESRRKRGFIFRPSRLLMLYTLRTSRKKILVGGCESCCVPAASPSDERSCLDAPTGLTKFHKVQCVNCF